VPTNGGNGQIKILIHPFRLPQPQLLGLPNGFRSLEANISRKKGILWFDVEESNAEIQVEGSANNDFCGHWAARLAYIFSLQYPRRRRNSNSAGAHPVLCEMGT
jgi:hypothetical protein